MSTPVLTVASFTEDVKLEMRIPVADVTEDALIYALLVEFAADLFRKHINDFDWLNVIAPSYVDTSTAKLDQYLIDSILRVEVYVGVGPGYVAIPHITQPTTPMSGGKPTHYSYQLEVSPTVPASSWLTKFKFYQDGSFTGGAAKIYFKGIKLPTSSADTTPLEFPFLYPELKKAILQRLQIKKGESDLAQLLQPTTVAPSK